MILCYEGALREPLLYLSYYFKLNRQAYYDLLQKVREDGDWEAWLRFFLEGVQVTSDQAASTAQRILRLFEADRQKIEGFGRAMASMLPLHHRLQRTPLISIPTAARMLNMTQPTVTTAFEHLHELGVVREVSGRQRNRLFTYNEYLLILEERTEPL